MICPKCGTDNPDYYVFCQNCFEELPKVDKPHKSTSRIAQTPIEQFAEPPAQQERAASAMNKESANEILNQYASFQQQGVRNPDEPYLTQKQYTKQEMPREDIRMDFDASKRQTAPPAKPRLLPMDAYDDEFGDAPIVQPIAPNVQPMRRQPQAAQQQQRRVTPVAAQKPKLVEPEFDEFADDFYDEMGQTTVMPKQQRKNVKPAKNSPASRKQMRAQAAQSAAQAEDIYNPYDDYEDDDMDAERKRGKVITLVFWVALLMLIGAVIFFVSNYAIDKYGSLNEAMAQVFNLQTAPKEIKVEATTNDAGDLVHQFFITGKVGQQISFDDLGRAFDLKDTERAFKVPDAYWIDEVPDPAVQTLTITPKLSIIDKETGEVLSNPTVAPFEIAVPQATLTITSPAPAEGVPVVGDTLEITGEIQPIDGRLTVNGEDASASLASDGTFKHVIPLNEIGAFTIEVKAEAGRTRAMTQTITGTREKGEIAITMTDGIPERTDAAEVAISGTIDPGSELVVEGAMKETTPTYDSATGAFSFTANLGDYGAYTYKITAKQGETLSEKSITITRIPDATKYTQSAKKLDYANVKKNPNDSSGKVFKFNAMLVETQTSDEGTKYLFAADGDGEKPVLITYYGASELKDAEKYVVYATANKNTADNSAIQMNAYFVYAEE